MGGTRGTVHDKCIQGVGGEYEVKRLLGRLGRKWEDNIKTDVKDVE
jgi:hypothetical protein